MIDIGALFCNKATHNEEEVAKAAADAAANAGGSKDDAANSAGEAAANPTSISVMILAAVPAYSLQAVDQPQPLSHLPAFRTCRLGARAADLS